MNVMLKNVFVLLGLAGVMSSAVAGNLQVITGSIESEPLLSQLTE